MYFVVGYCCVCVFFSYGPFITLHVTAQNEMKSKGGAWSGAAVQEQSVLRAVVKADSWVPKGTAEQD